MTEPDDTTLIIDDEPDAGIASAAPAWKLLLVDDEADVHSATVFALARVRILDRRLEFRHAHSSAEALACLRREPDIAVVLLDVVMESEDSGLTLVRQIRHELGLDELRIILRTGQPGYAPELEVIRDYDINDYRTKSELTRTRLTTALTAALRSYQQVRALKASRSELDRANGERLELEARLRQSQKMESIGQLAGGIAHDFNNILGALRGYTDLARMLPAAADGDLATYLDEIEQAIERARELVRQLLTFSRSNEREAADDIRPGPVVREVVKLLKATFPASIAVGAELPAELPLVRIKPVNLHQVLMNLAINARDAIAGNGRVDLRAAAIARRELATCSSCHGSFSGDFVALAVRDDGSGIAAADRERIFDPFFTTKPVGKGSGLGLPVLHGIVHAAGGHIEVRSAPGEGSEFVVYLPAVAAAEPGSDSLPPPRPGHEALAARILAVDDEPAILKAQARLLELNGATVAAFGDPRAALEAFTADPAAFDLAILDQTMPGLTGTQLAAELLRLRPELPVVICSGNAELATAPGVRACLDKPVPAVTLLSTVRGLCVGAGESGR